MSDMTGAAVDPFQIDRFLPLVGEVFRIVVNEQEDLRVLLTEVARLVSDERWGGRSRDPFSLVFHGPADIYAPQATYRLEHENGVIEPFDALVVPLGPDANGMRYEIIFT